MAEQLFGIIGAMDSEVAYLKSQLEHATSTRVSGMEFYKGELAGASVVLVKCGIGKVSAAMCTQTLIDCFGVTHVINTGVAGSLDARINIGDIVVSTDAVQHDFNVSALGYKLGQIPDLDVLAFPADRDLCSKAVDAVGRVAPEVDVHEGRIASGDLFVSSMTQKIRLSQRFDAICCEMEGAAIAQVCYVSGVPFVVVRAISDKADGSSHMDYGAFELAAADRCARIVEELVRQ